MNIARSVAERALSHPTALAATADGETLTYAGFAEAAGRLGGWLHGHGAKRVAILGSRSLGAFTAVIGSAWAGAAYVPLSLKAPSERLVAMMEQVRPDVLVVDRHGAALMDGTLLASAPVLVADEATNAILRGTRGELPTVCDLAAPRIDPVAVSPADTAYITFTSGTTGVPKGVVVSVGARAALIEVLRGMFHLGPRDRIAETADLSFDISVANMILAWESGGSLHAVPSTSMVAPARFIRSEGITLWLSVPSVITTMMQTGALRPGILGTLRHSIFIGEALPALAAGAWAEAAPNSRLYNLYGPTEATFGCMGQVVAPQDATCLPMVAIGRPFQRMKARIVGPDLAFLPAGTQGELVVAGPQLADGYLGRPDLTAARFPVIGGERWYRTGDTAVEDADGTFRHLGRLDNQLKVRGYRVELEDVESHIRAVSGSSSVAAMGLPAGSASAESLVGFTVGAAIEPSEIIRKLADRLPAYMVPSALHSVEALPLTANGKLDRSRLSDLIPVLPRE